MKKIASCRTKVAGFLLSKTMKIKGSKFGTIIASTGVVVFTLAAAFSGTYAWFQATRTTSSNTGEFRINNIGDCVTSIEFHRFDSIRTIDQVEYFAFSSSEFGSVTINNNRAVYTSSLEMEEYSTDDAHHPILILISLKNSGNANFRARRTNNDVDYDYMASEEYTLEERENNTLSSVVEFFSFTYASDGETSLASRTRNGYYTLPVSDFERDPKDAKAFPEFNNDGDYTGNFRSQVSIYNGPTEGYTHIGIVVDYFAESLEYIFSYFLGNDLLSDGLSFTCDWSLYL